jgi:FMN-dependent NADH-azoreductase
MHILNIVTSSRKEKSASTAIVNAFFSEYREHVRDVTVDKLDIWQEQLPEFDAAYVGSGTSVPAMVARDRSLQVHRLRAPAPTENAKALFKTVKRKYVSIVAGGKR